MSPNTFYTFAYCCQAIAAITSISFVTDIFKTKKQKGCVLGIVILLLFAVVYLNYQGKEKELFEAREGARECSKRYKEVNDSLKTANNSLVSIKDDVKDIKKAINDSGYDYDSINKTLIKIEVNNGYKVDLTGANLSGNNLFASPHSKQSNTSIRK